MACLLLKDRSDKWKSDTKKRKKSARNKRNSDGSPPPGSGDDGDDYVVKDEELPLLRIVVLSDGENTMSTVSAYRYARESTGMLGIWPWMGGGEGEELEKSSNSLTIVLIRRSTLPQLVELWL